MKKKEKNKIIFSQRSTQRKEYDNDETQAHKQERLNNHNSPP